MSVLQAIVTPVSSVLLAVRALCVVPSFANTQPGLLRILIPSHYMFWVHCLSVVHVVRFSDAAEI
jgi:hypothetical protein